MLLQISCSTGLTKTQIVKVTERVPYPVPVEIFCPELAIVTGTDLISVKFKEIEDDDGVWWVSLTPSQYERLSLNTADMERYQKELRSVSDHYKSCIAKSKEKVDIPDVNE